MYGRRILCGIGVYRNFERTVVFVVGDELLICIFMFFLVLGIELICIK